MSKLRANQLTDKASTGAPTAPNGMVVTGVTTSTTFSGSGSGLTGLTDSQIPNLNASKITAGTLPATRGGTGLSSLGTAGQALKVNSAGNALEYGSAGGLVKLAEADLSSQTLSNITLNYFTTTYKVYKLFISHLYFSSNTRPRMRFVLNSNSQVQTASQYSWNSMHPYVSGGGTNHNTHGEWTASYGEMHGQNSVHTTWSVAGEYTFYDPMSTTRKTQCTYYSVGEESDRGQHNQHIGAIYGLQLEQYKGIYIYPLSGTISAIKYQLYGLIT